MDSHENVVLSSLGKTWVLDLDGTIVKHNGYLIDGKDSFLDGAKEFFDSISNEDMVIFLTSRKIAYKDQTEKFLQENGIRYSNIIYEAPYGERILINDIKPSGLTTAIAINTIRDKFHQIHIEIDDNL